jgi:hypothetical protein
MRMIRRGVEDKMARGEKKRRAMRIDPVTAKKIRKLGLGHYGNAG